MCSIPCPQLVWCILRITGFLKLAAVSCVRKVPQFGANGSYSRPASRRGKYINMEKFKSQHRSTHIHHQTNLQVPWSPDWAQLQQHTAATERAELCSRCQTFSCHLQLDFGTRWSKYLVKVRCQTFTLPCLCRQATGCSFSGPYALSACPIRVESSRRKPTVTIPVIGTHRGGAWGAPGTHHRLLHWRCWE